MPITDSSLLSLVAPVQQAAAPERTTAAGDDRVGRFAADNLSAAMLVAERRRVPVDAVLGQWGLETDWGARVVPGTNNLGNVKAGSAWNGQTVQATDNATGSRDPYRAYASREQAAEDFIGLLSKPRYARASGAPDAESYFRALKQGGYAEDPDYVQKGSSAAAMVRARLGLQAPTASGDPAQPYGNSLSDIEAARQRAKGATAGDVVRSGTAAALEGLGAIAQLPGEALASIANDATGTQDYKGFNPLKGVANKLRGTMTPGGQAAREDGFRGDLFSPETWKTPETASGALITMADGFGSLVPAVVPFLGQASRAGMMTRAGTEALTAARAAGDVAKIAEAQKVLEVAAQFGDRARAIGAATGGAMTGGSAADSARENVRQLMGQMNHEQLLESVPAYGQAFQQYGNERDARNAVENSAAQHAGVIAGAMGALGGAFNAKVVDDVLAKRGVSALLGKTSQNGVVRTATGAAAGTVGEGLQETSEQVGQNVGENMGMGRAVTDNAGRDTFGAFVGGAMVGGPVGAVGGALSAPSQTPAATPPPTPVLQPNSPLSDAAAVAGSVAPASPAGVVSADPNADPLANRVQAVDATLTPVIRQMRETPGYGAEGVDALLQTFARARNPQTEPALRERLLATLEQELSTLRDRSAQALRGDGAPQLPPPEGAPTGFAADAQGNAYPTFGSRGEILPQGEVQDGRPVARQPEQIGFEPPGALAWDGIAAAKPDPTLYATQSGTVRAATQQAQGRAAVDQFNAGRGEELPALPNDNSPVDARARIRPAFMRAAMMPNRSITDDGWVVAADGRRITRLNPAEIAQLRGVQNASDRGIRAGSDSAGIDASGSRGNDGTGDQGANIDGINTGSPAVGILPDGPVADAGFSPDVAGEATELIDATPAGLDYADWRSAVGKPGEIPAAGSPQQEAERAQYLEYRQRTEMPSVVSEVDVAANEAATSPLNDLPAPDAEQRESGEYQKGRVTVAGIEIEIENPAGSERSGTDDQGEPWRNILRDHYGDLVGTTGADGDPIDIFITPGLESDYDGPWFVVDQKNDKGSFDEHKAVAGAATRREAVAIYRRNYSPGWDGVLSVADFADRDIFARWLKEGDHKKPAADFMEDLAKSLDARIEQIAKLAGRTVEESRAAFNGFVASRGQAAAERILDDNIAKRLKPVAPAVVNESLTTESAPPASATQAAESAPSSAQAAPVSTENPSDSDEDAGSGIMAARRSGATINSENRLAAVFTAIASYDEAFQRPTSAAKDPVKIADEIAGPDFAVRELNKELPEEFADEIPYQMWEIGVPTSTVRAGMMYDDGKNVWIDVSALRPDVDRGNAIYDIAAAYAHNNGKVFIGDPMGLSPVAFFRRLENMISSALKFGTTDHLAPHAAQVNPERYFAKEHPDFAEAVTGLGLDWKPGDTAHNLKSMLLASYNAAARFMPEALDITYDFDRGAFYRGSERIDRDDLKDLPRKDVGEGPRAGARYYAGSATTARVVLVNTVVRATREGQWDGVLAALVHQLQGSSGNPGGLPGSLEGIFYADSRTKRTTSTVESILAELTGEVGKTKAGRINVVQSAGDLPAAIGKRASRVGTSDLAGLYDPDTKTSYLIADKIPRGEAMSFLMHEIGVHQGMAGLIGQGRINALATQLRIWSRLNDDSDRPRIAKAAAARIPSDTKPEHYNEELVAYFVTEAVQSGYGDPKPDSQGPIQRWFARLWQMVRDALEKLGANPDLLTVEDVVALARGALESELGGTRKMADLVQAAPDADVVADAEPAQADDDMVSAVWENTSEAGREFVSGFAARLAAGQVNMSAGFMPARDANPDTPYRAIRTAMEAAFGEPVITDLLRKMKLRIIPFDRAPKAVRDQYPDAPMGVDMRTGSMVMFSDRLSPEQAVALARGLMEKSTGMIEVDGVMRPTTNSNGKPIHPTQEGVRNFWKWFGDSRVVDEQGRPLVVYHGTQADFAEFSRDKIGSATFGTPFDSGFFFAKDPIVAGRYSNRDGGNVMPVYLKVERPAATVEAFQENLEMHDGFQNSKIALVREPSQIKSATGNAGTFSPDNNSIMAARAPQAPQAAWATPTASKLDNITYVMQDKQVDTKRVVQAISDAVGDIRDEWDAYLQEELYHGRAAKGVSEFLETDLKPLMEEMRVRGVTMEALEDYLHARHAEERNAAMAEINPDNPDLQDGGSGMNTQDARDYLGGLSAADRANLDALAQRVDAITAGTRDLLVSSGLESAETVASWSGAYKHYVPLMRAEMDAGGSSSGTGQGFSVRGSATKRAMGSKREVVDILANVMQQRERAIVRAEKNRVATALYGLAVQAPNPEFWLPVNPDANQGSTAETAALVNELIRMGLNPADADSVAREPRQRYVSPTTGLVEERINPALRMHDNVLALRVDGRDRFVFFNQRDERASRMVGALKNLDADQLGRVLGVMGKVSRYFAAINTQYNPVFGIINFVRDVQGAMFNLSTTDIAGKQREVLSEVPKVMAAIYADLRARRSGKPVNSPYAALFEEYERAGGRTGYRDAFATTADRTEALQRELDPNRWTDTALGKIVTAGGTLKAPLIAASPAFRGVFGWLSDYNDVGENTIRLAAYKVARDQGMTPERAASVAKNLTVNFNRKGQIATQAGAMYAFFNASVQGTARLAETLRGPMGKKIMAGGVLLGSVQALALAAAGFGDDEPPEFVRERNIIIPTGGGKYISIPMPLGLHVIPNIGRIITELALSGGEGAGKKAASMVGVVTDSFNPLGSAGLSIQTIAPTAVDPFVALSENRDFAGRQIYREDFSAQKPTPGFTRAKDTATSYATGIAKALNWASGGSDFSPGVVSPSPDAIDFLIGQVTGGVGREISKVEQTVTAGFSGEALPTYKIPLVGRLYGDARSSSAVSNSYYATLRQMNLHKAEIEGRKDAGLPVAEYLAEHPEAKLAEWMTRRERMIANMRKARKQLLQSDADRARVEAIEARIADQMRDVTARITAARD